MSWEDTIEEETPDSWERTIQDVPQPKSLREKAAEYLGTAAKNFDSITGAPTRAAIGAIQDGKGLGGAASTFAHSFAGDPDQAPTGKEIAEKAGFDGKTTFSESAPWAFTDKPGFTLQAKKGGFLDATPAGTIGLGVDILSDPTNLIPSRIATKAIASPLRKSEQVLETIARRRAAKQAGAVTVGDFRRLSRTGQLDNIGKEALDQGLVTPLSSVATVGDRATELKNASGEKLGSFRDAIDSKFEQAANSDLHDKLFNPSKVADKFDTEILSKLGINEDLGSEVAKVRDRLRDIGDAPIPFGEAEMYKRQLDQRIPWKKNSAEWTPQERLLVDARKILKDEIDNGVQSITERTNRPETFNDYLEAKRQYGAGKGIEKMAGDKVLRDQANRWVSPSDYAIGSVTGGASYLENPEDRTSALLSGALGAGANKLVRNYGNAVVATGARRASELSGKVANAIQTAGPAARRAGQLGLGIERSSRQTDTTPIADAQLDIPAITSKLTRAQVNALSGTKYARQFLEAAKRGENAVSTTHFLLSQQDPEYQELMKKANTR